MTTKSFVSQDKTKYDTGLIRVGPAVIRVKVVVNKDGKDVLLMFARPLKGAKILLGEGKGKRYGIIGVVDR